MSRAAKLGEANFLGAGRLGAPVFAIKLDLGRTTHPRTTDSILIDLPFERGLPIPGSLSPEKVSELVAVLTPMGAAVTGPRCSAQPAVKICRGTLGHASDPYIVAQLNLTAVRPLAGAVTSEIVQRVRPGRD